MSWDPSNVRHLAVGAAVARTLSSHAIVHHGSDTGTRASGDSWVGAEHADTGAELRPSQRHHVLADVSSHDLTVLRVGMSENVLDEVVSVLVTGDVDKRNPRSIETTFADSIQITPEELGTTDLQAFLNDLGSELIHRVLCGVSNDMIDGTATVGGGTVLADVLDTPITELTVGHNIDVSKDFLDAGALQLALVSCKHGRQRIYHQPCHLLDSSQKCFGPPDSQSRLEQPRATYHGETR